MISRPPIASATGTLLPYATLVRWGGRVLLEHCHVQVVQNGEVLRQGHGRGGGARFQAAVGRRAAEARIAEGLHDRAQATSLRIDVGHCKAQRIELLPE